MRIDDIRPLEKNPRRISKEALDRLCQSIQRDPAFMRLRPIVVDGEGIILGGNQRWKACKRLGMTTLPDGWVVRASDLTPEQRRRFILVDNAPDGMSGDWDVSALQAEWDLTELAELGFEGMEIPGDEAGLDAHDEVITDSQAAQLQAKWGTSLGQLWTAGPHRILCGSSTEPENWIRLMRGERAAICVTDPPYGVSFTSSTGRGKKWEMIQGDDKREDNLLATLLVPAMRRMLEHTAPDAAFYIWHASSTRRDFEQALDTVGLEEKQYIVWIKDGFVLGHADYHWQQEPCFYAQKAGESARWLGDRSQATVWKIRPPAPAQMAASLANGLRVSDGNGRSLYLAPKAPKGRKTRLIRLGESDSLAIAAEHSTDAWEVSRDASKDKLHPTQKPVRLFTIPILNHTNPGDLLIEAFSGSGAQFVAAHRTGRRCNGMDNDPKYVAVALERLTAEGLTCEREG